MEMVGLGFAISEKYQIPVILRPSIRICHARQWIHYNPPMRMESVAAFSKDPGRWAATPKFRLALHHKLNDKLDRIASQEGGLNGLNRLEGPEPGGPIGIVAAGPPLAHLRDLLKDWDLQLPLLAVGLSHPLDPRMLKDFADAHHRVLVLEEPGDAIETAFDNRTPVLGRLSGHVPRAGEITPEVAAEILDATLLKCGIPLEQPSTKVSSAIATAMEKAEKPPRRPTLCPGCPHRSAFYAIRKALPKALYTSDIGCYTLGINLRAVDTCLNMGAAISMASGFDHAHRSTGQEKTIIATIGDSTFFHSGLTGLLNAVYTDARFVLVILDNQITAMTGMQPTPASGVLADGTMGNPVSLEEAVKGCGVRWMKVVEPYQFEEMGQALLDAQAYTRSEQGGVAVLIARAPCLINERNAKERWRQNRVEVDLERCEGCGLCIHTFECPALIQDNKKEKVRIDRTLCVSCGSCLNACKNGALCMECGDGSGSEAHK
jgi:indolepyruvate ferredoxin oxidoreductase alpha subunit